jgi:hypothetical protein
VDLVPLLLAIRKATGQFQTEQPAQKGSLREAAFCFIRRACSAARGCKSLPNLMEVRVAKRKGVTVRWGLKEAWSKDTGRWTRGQELDLRPPASDELANDREVRIHQGRWW